MSIFALLMIAGVLGLLAMALPGLFHHGGHRLPGHLRPLGARHLPTGHSPAHPLLPARFVPEPRAILSLVALVGAFGNVFHGWLHLSVPLSFVLSVIPAAVLELVLVRPLWRLALKFQGRPSTPLTHLLMEQAVAVTPFRNGKGMVEVVRDGRTVQLSARLLPAQQDLTVRVGDKLRIEDVDPKSERLTVSAILV